MVMDGLQKTGKVSGAEHTRDTQEAEFKGYSVEIGRPAGVKASDVPEVHIRSHRGIWQMLCDTVTDLTTKGLSVGDTKESRKLDAMIEYIKKGEGYGVGGDSHVYADLLENRASALEQVLKSPSASSEQKRAAVAAFEGALTDARAIGGNDKGARALCVKLVEVDGALEGDDKNLLSGIKKQVAGRILSRSEYNSFKQLLKEREGRLSEGMPDALADLMRAEVKVLKHGRDASAEGLLLKLETAVSRLDDKSFNAKLSAINDKIAAYTQATGGKPQAGEKHDAHVMDMVSSLRELYQQVSQELMSPDLERGGQREKDVKAALNGLKSLAKNIVNAEPIAGSTLERKSLAGLYVAVNDDLKQMGFGRHDKVFLGRTN